MYIVAEELPWAISIKRYNIITCQDVLDNIYKALQEPVKRDEFFAANPKKRAQVTKVALRVRRNSLVGQLMLLLTNVLHTGGGRPRERAGNGLQ